MTKRVSDVVLLPHTVRVTQAQNSVSTGKQKTLAWGVHALTLSGLVWASFAMVALSAGRAKEMFLFLGIAAVTDALDGPLARKFKVKEYAPGFDGAILDNIIDYLTWTFIPAYFLSVFGYLGPPPVAAVLFILILVSSTFCYANVSLKTAEWYFTGFPAAWNIVAVYFFVLNPPLWLNIAVTIYLSAITIVPITFLHPFRVKRLRIFNVVATTLWLGSSVTLVALAPVTPVSVSIIWWVSGVWIIASGLLGGLIYAKRARAARMDEARST